MATYVKECPIYGTATHGHRETKTETATKKVLNTPEILETVLLQLDMITVLTSAQRVCRTWMNVISKSPSIQKALFFTPIQDFEWGGKARVPNPLLADAFPSFFPSKDGSIHRDFDFTGLKMTRNTSTMAQFTRKEASWRRMLAQQPAVAGVGHFHMWHGLGGTGAGSSSMPADKRMQELGYHGLRMERLFEFLLFSGKVEFLPWNTTRMYWATEESIPTDMENQKFDDEFRRSLSEFGVVLFTEKTTQCCPPMISSAEELLRGDIIEAYTEHEFDIIVMGDEIDEQEDRLLDWEY